MGFASSTRAGGGGQKLRGGGSLCGQRALVGATGPGAAPRRRPSTHTGDARGLGRSSWTQQVGCCSSLAGYHGHRAPARGRQHRAPPPRRVSSPASWRREGTARAERGEGSGAGSPSAAAALPRGAQCRAGVGGQGCSQHPPGQGQGGCPGHTGVVVPPPFGFPGPSPAGVPVATAGSAAGGSTGTTGAPTHTGAQLPSLGLASLAGRSAPHTPRLHTESGNWQSLRGRRGLSLDAQTREPALPEFKPRLNHHRSATAGRSPGENATATPQGAGKAPAPLPRGGVGTKLEGQTQRQPGHGATGPRARSHGATATAGAHGAKCGSHSSHSDPSSGPRGPTPLGTLPKAKGTPQPIPSLTRCPCLRVDPPQVARSRGPGPASARSSGGGGAGLSVRAPCPHMLGLCTPDARHSVAPALLRSGSQDSALPVPSPVPLATGIPAPAQAPGSGCQSRAMARLEPRAAAPRAAAPPPAPLPSDGGANALKSHAPHPQCTEPD